MKLNHITEEFALTVLEAAIQRNSRIGGKELKDIVAGAIQICIDADRAIEDYVKRSGCSCRTRQELSRGL